MKTPEPIKRHSALQPLSKEHHDGLLLCWKIKIGLTKSIDPGRIKKYADWFYKNNLKPHFEIEEKYIFTILGNKHEMVKRALAEHRKIKRLIEANADPVKSLSIIEEELENHIRFEERILFNKIQEIASEKEMALIIAKHARTIDSGQWADSFWNEVN